VSLLFAIALASSVAPRAMTESGAIELVAKAVHQIYPAEALRCFSFETEERSRTAFGIAVRENHGRGCGGDPGVMPVRERFRVGRSPASLSRLDPVQDTYVRCKLVGGRPVCLVPLLNDHGRARRSGSMNSRRASTENSRSRE
jgi:hypothetical protein